jgi:hypothetical protein
MEISNHNIFIIETQKTIVTATNIIFTVVFTWCVTNRCTGIYKFGNKYFPLAYKMQFEFRSHYSGGKVRLVDREIWYFIYSMTTCTHCYTLSLCEEFHAFLMIIMHSCSFLSKFFDSVINVWLITLPIIRLLLAWTSVAVVLNRVEIHYHHWSDCFILCKIWNNHIS